MLLRYIGTPDFTINTGYAQVTVVTGQIVQCRPDKYKYLIGNYASVFQAMLRLDLTVSDVPSAPTLITVDDTGVSDSDGITKKTNPIVITISGVPNADYYQLSTDDGATWSTEQYTTTFIKTLTEGTYTVVARAVNYFGASAKSSALTLVVDRTASVLSTVTLASDNSTTTLAKVGDTVTVTIIANENIQQPSGTIGVGVATAVAGVDAAHWTLTRALTSGDASGAVPFSVAFTDLAGNVGTPVTAVTGGSGVTFDKTLPTATLTYSIDAGANYTTSARVNDADTLRIKAVFSEAVKDSPVPKLTIDNAVLAATNMTKTSATEYYYDLNVPVGDIATATCSVTLAQDLAGNAITAAPTNATFTIDNTVPTISSAVRNSDTQITVTLSQLALASSITKANDGGFVVTETGGVATYAVSAVAPGATDDLAVLTVANMLVSGKEGVTVTYVAGVNGTVSDVAGNALATDATGAAVTAWDTTAPTMITAERLSNTVIKVTLSENGDDATLTQANDGGFVVFETDTPGTTYAVSATAKSGSNSNMIELTVADMTVSAALGVTVTYASTGNGIITDVAGTDMATDAVGVVANAWA